MLPLRSSRAGCEYETGSCLDAKGNPIYGAVPSSRKSSAYFRRVERCTIPLSPKIVGGQIAAQVYEMAYRSLHDKSMGVTAIRTHVKETLRKEHDATPPTTEECVAQIDRLVASPLFLGSEALCKLLRYLAHHTINAPTYHLKEHQIATEAFGRRSDYDPQTDSYVRVQIGRLRAKLADYYEGEGAADKVLVDVPKGRHVLSFERRGDTAPVNPAGEAEAAPPPAVKATILSTPLHSKRLALVTMAALLAIALGAASFAAFRIWHVEAGAQLGRQASPRQAEVLMKFWAPFLRGPEEPIVVFANANFVGDAETGMRYYEPSRDARTGITQHYTGVGEVMGVLELDRLLQGLGHQFRVKRGSLFTLDDARSNNLIFVGSPTENLTLGQIPGTQEFVFHHAAEGHDRWQVTIINTHPAAGESNVYVPSDVRDHDGDDYAVIALRRGLDSSRWTLILAGASTIGTQAAADYVCDSGSIANLLKQMNVSKAADLKPFEALLRIKVTNDVPLTVELVALRQTEH
jgi:hypothetical protein